MGKSFYFGTDAQLYTGSNAFSAKINLAPTSYGLSAPQAAAYQTLNDIYSDCYLAALDPEQRTKGKVKAKNDAKTLLKLKASELAKIIGATPTVTNEQKLDLGLSVREVPTPVTELGKPSDCKVSLGENGAITLKWKCSSPRATGMVYQVFRRVGGEGEFIYLGGTGEKKFTDSTLPMGSSQLTYQIQAVRSTASGPWAQFNVNFGTGSGGSMMASVTETKPTKLAA